MNGRPERSEGGPAKPGSPRETPAFRPGSFIFWAYVNFGRMSMMMKGSKVPAPLQRKVMGCWTGTYEFG